MKTGRMTTLVDGMFVRNASLNEHVLYSFLSNTESLDVTYGMLHDCSLRAAGYLQQRFHKGDRLILALKPGFDFVVSFFGCMCAGMIPIPLYPPFSHSFIRKINHVIDDAEPMGLITTRDVSDAGEKLGWTCTRLEEILFESFTGEWAEHWTDPAVSPDDIAFIQYTSGSTNHPKGVMVSHGNIIHNEGLIREGFGLGAPEEVTGVGWLPLYHDMGLIGIVLQAFYSGYKAVLMSPLDFLVDPLSWLENVSRTKAVISGGPNFAYELCVRKYDAKRCENLDLSHWNIAFSGAEPVRGDTIDRFCALYGRHGFRRSSFTPCYGLAENTLFVSCAPQNARFHDVHADKDHFSRGIVVPVNEGTSDSVRLIAHGKTPDGQLVRIVDPDNRHILADQHVGEIWVKGPSVARGYWNRPELSDETFRAFTGDGDGPYLRTGDLGFMMNGELYIAGRRKDMMIFKGRNFYPQDIELSTETAGEGIRPGRVASFQVDDDLYVAAEYTGPVDTGITEKLLKRIAAVIKKDHELNVSDVILVPPKSLPVTTSGKIRRNETRKRYADHGFQMIDRLSAHAGSRMIRQERPGIDREDLQYTLTEKLAVFFNIPSGELDPDQPFGNYGLTSSEAVELTEELEKMTGRICSPTLFYDYPTVNKLIHFFTGSDDAQVPGLNSGVSKERDFGDDIAIIGMSCRFPGADSPSEFLDNLEKGVSSVHDFPDDIRGLYLDTARGHFARCGGFIKDIDGFDAEYFRINAMEARLMDPQHRLFLQTVWNTFENAGYAPQKLAGADIGIFAGVSSFDYHDVIRKSGAEPEAYMATGLAHTMIANRISYILDFHGPSEAIDTACSSSLVAVYRAISAMRQGDCSMAIAGGVNLLISGENFTSLGRSGLLSGQGQCSTFGSNADGYVRGEGVGAVLLKPLADAQRDGDFIHAVIKGSAVSHGGRTESLTAPCAPSQARLVTKAVLKAGIEPESIGYVETHGTGTFIGDPIEISGLSMAFRDIYKDMGRSVKTGACALGSVKSRIGHLESAAGIAGLIKVVEMLKRQVITPNNHLEEVNSLIALSGSPFFINREKMAWKKPHDLDGRDLPRRAGISSFGFGGSYAHLILEEYPAPDMTAENSAEQLAVYSARTREGLVRMAASHLAWLEDRNNSWMTGEGLFHYAHTLMYGRDHDRHRLAVVAGGRDSLVSALQRFVSGETDSPDAFEGVAVKENAAETPVSGSLREKAAKWVSGGCFDESVRTRFKKLPLPGYVFETRSYFALGDGSVRDQGAQSPEAVVAVRRSFEDVTGFLKQRVADMLGFEAADVDTDSTFDEWGMDSVAVISVINRLEEWAGMEIPSTVFKDHRTIRGLARYVAEGLTIPETHLDLVSETELDEFLFRHETPMASPSGKNLFLTGCTGYLGSYLLVELLLKTDADIHCLVRAESREKGMERICDAVKRFGAADDIPLNRIHAVVGDLGEWRLGLDRNEFTRLCQVIDTIWHCGATVDWMKPFDALKKTNVEGTREVIRMAGTSQIKTLHFISSLAVLPLVHGKNRWFEEEVNDPRGITTGYGQSKWVAEQLCLKARRWRIPVHVYRFDYVAGTPGRGVMKESDFIARLIKGCIRMGTVPQEETNFDIIPVDHLCRMLTAIARSGDTPGRIYHLINKRPYSTSDFARLIRERGYKLTRIPFETWKKQTRKDKDNALYPLYPFINGYDKDTFESYSFWTVDNTNTMKALFAADPDMIRFIPDPADILKSVMDYLEKRNAIPRGMFGPVAVRQMAYWEKQLADAPLGIPLPANHRAPDDQEKRNSLKTHAFSMDFPETGKQAIAELGLTEKDMVLSAVAILLSRYGRQNDILMDFAEIGHGDRDMSLHRFFIRTGVDSGENLGLLALTVKQLASEAKSNGDISVDMLERYLGLTRDTYPVQCVWTVLPDAAGGMDMKAPVRLVFSPDDTGRGRLYGVIVYDSERYDDALAVNMAGHLSQLVRNFAGHLGQPLSSLPMLSDDERLELMGLNCDSAMDYPEGRLIHGIFSENAKKYPLKTALRFQGKSLTFGELDRLSGLASSLIQASGLGRGHVVGLAMEKSMTLMVALMGILKSGAAYLPLDLDYPEDRLKHMVSDAGLRLIITDPGREGHGAWAGVKTLAFDGDGECLRDIRTSDSPAIPDTGVSHTDPAYIIYTSGSTGKPKGVVATHQGIVNLVHAMNRLVDFRPDHTMLCLTRLSFDMVKPELFIPLLLGGTMHILPPDIGRDGYLLKDFLENHPVNLMQATPSSWRLLLYAGWEGHPDMTLITGGEPLSPDLAGVLATKGKKLLNCYGPTETTVWSTAAEITAESGVHIGRALGNTKLYVLGPDLQPVPKGIPGELFIGGHGVTRGYHGQPELTRSRFLPDSFSGEENARMYRTGDLVRLRKDMALEYIERLDHQVKVRGYRIELQEIEQAILGVTGVREAVVQVVTDDAGDKSLAAWLVADLPESQSPGDRMIRDHVAKTLPPWMVPTHMVFLDAMPLNSNGKIDRNRLPDPRKNTGVQVKSQPVSDTEKILTALWEQNLGIPLLGIDDDFIEWGGDSLKAMKLLVEINERFGVSLTVQRLFENMTVRKLSETLERMMNGEADRESDTVETMLADAVFASDGFETEDRVQAEDGREFSQVFLTGATGYLGAYLLRDLLEKTNARVFCLVRAGNVETAMARIASNLEHYGIWKNAYAQRITALPGDLAKTRFGLDEEVYAEAAIRSDAVIHNGAMVNFSYPYGLLKKANVTGTREILAFAAKGRVKPLCYVSTIGVFERKDPDVFHPVGEDSELPGAAELYYGYSQSKWVAEKMVRAYRELGRPVTIVRPGPIYGDSRSGVLNVEDFFCRMISACARFNAVPDLGVELDGLPVDHVSRIIVDMALSSETLGRNYNIVSPFPLNLNDLLDGLDRAGYAPDRLSVDEWVNMLRRSAVDDPALSAFLPLVDDVLAGTGGRTFFQMQTVRRQRYSCSNLVEFLAVNGLAMEPLHRDVFLRYTEYMRSEGFIRTHAEAVAS